MKIIIMGKSAAGKNHLARKMKELRLNQIVTDTTRAMRPGERDGVDYNFVSEKDFLRNISESKYMEYKSYETINGTVYYGSRSTAFENGDFIILTPSGVKDIAPILVSRRIKYQTILLDADKDLRLQRSLKRGDKVEEVLRRYDKDERDFRNVEAAICFNTTEWTDREVTAAAEMLRDLCRK